MKKNKIFILALGMGLFTSAFAENPGNVSVCIKGNGAVPGVELRTFAVNISGDGDRQANNYMELKSGNSSQSSSFAVNAPKHLKVIEPGNAAFKCETNLDPKTRSVVVMINYPPDFMPYCTITTSSNTQQNC